jgi:glycosyltransferase involved in cell wall biosynthesis
MISVVIPTYNNEDTIGRAITSVASQTYHDWQVVIVNDCSTDNTLKFIQDNFKVYYKDKIKIISNSENMGAGVSRKIGVDNADGEFVIFLDSDDYLIPNCLEVSLDLQKQQDADVVYTDAIIYFDQNRSWHHNVPNCVMEGKISPTLHINCTKKWLTGKMFRTELLKRTPMSPKRIAEDTNTLFYACYLAKTVRSCPYCGYVHVYRPNSLLGLNDRPFYYYCLSALCDFEMADFLLDHKDENTFYKFIMMPYINYLSHVEKIKSGLISGEELEESKDMWKTIREWYMSRKDDIETKCDIENRLKQMNIKR